MITRLDPNGAGFYNPASWVASTGTKTSCVDDGASANDTDFISGGDAGTQTQTFTMTDLPGYALAPTSITLTARMKRDGGTYNDGGLFWRSNSTNANIAKSIVGGSYSDQTDTRTTDPSGGGAWTVARTNGLECGVYFLSSFAGEYVYCSWIKADATHPVAAGGFAFLCGQWVGAALGLAEMAKVSRHIYAKTKTLITPDEYFAAWRDIREHRWPVSIHV